MSRLGEWTPEQIEYLKSNYKDYNWEQIGKELNRKTESVRKKAQKLGLSRYGYCWSKYTHNTTFFNIPNIINSYWAGFIAADGNLWSFQNRRRLTIKLSDKDGDHLKTFKEDINATNVIRLGFQKAGPTSLVKNKDKIYGTAGLEISMFHECYEALHKNFNITECKSLTLKPPNLDWENSLSFLKGYIDGDGCVSFYKSKDRPKLRLNLSVQGTFEMLDWIKDIFAKIYGSETGRQISQKPGNRIYEYRCNDLKAYIVGEEIRKSVNRGLDRKWDNLSKANSLYSYGVGV